MRMNGILTLSLATGLAVFLLAPVVKGDHDRDDHDRRRAGQTAALQASPGYGPYLAECGSCHLAFPPGLLPARSWRALMGNLAKHFGDDASLEADVTRGLTDWLVAAAAEAGTHRKSAKVLRSVRPGSTPSRISEVPYLWGKHDEIAPEVFRRPAVTSRANCGACHRDAERWVFDDDDARIPSARQAPSR